MEDLTKAEMEGREQAMHGKYDGITKTFPENWDSKAPSVGILLAYLET